ncbi:uncharacterized protein LOC126659921 [Mercurialis annua]|uniref:uncharacterized protein LOC126659921 n=1 Tax=Mercurialis annua TaxID=3986 RepID=UPI00215DF3FC|nr:uncharacterized protein LOC126659921 [Mercurialis annua]
MVTSLPQLKKIQVRNCEFLKEIIFTEEHVEETEILFPNLERLVLEGLPKLSRFCIGHRIKFRSLKRLHIKDCDALNTLVAYNQQVNSETEFLFNGMVGFPELEELRLSKMDNLTNIWHGQLMSRSFCQLKVLIIQDCRNLSMVFPPEELLRFNTLERLHIRRCNSLQEIFQFEEMNANAAVAFKLRELIVFSLENLRTIWSQGPQTSFIFKELQSVEAVGCKLLKNIFPTSVATGLSQLASLTIRRCGVDEIVAKDECEASNPEFKFPKLTSLILERLFKLKCFYPGKNSVEWPKLKCLEFIQCDSEIMFGSEITNHYREGGGGSEITNYRGGGGGGLEITNYYRGGGQNNISSQPFFMFEKYYHDLEELTLDHNDLKKLIHIYQSPASCFSNVIVFRLLSLGPRSSIALFDFLETLYSLESLIFYQCASMVLFSDENYVPPKHVSIYNSFFLNYIWKKDARSEIVTENLETLTIGNCGRLIKIVNSGASFKSLTTLKVGSCPRLDFLLTVSTAKTMVNLVEMSVYGVVRMTVVVAGDGNKKDQGEVVFKKLKTLQLKDARRLKSFHGLTQNAFNFPMLEEVCIDGCPRMQSFSFGVLTTPKLRSVIVSKYSPNKQFWDGDLNATIAYLFRERMWSTSLNKVVVNEGD